MDKLTRKVTEDKGAISKKKKVKLNVLKYGLKKKSDSDSKLNVAKDNHTGSHSKEDLTEDQPKKSKKDKKPGEPKSNKTSFISKLKLSKLTSSPSRQRGEAKSVTSTKREGSNLLSSDPDIPSSTLVAAAYVTPIDQEPPEIAMSDASKQPVEGEPSDLPEKSPDNIVTTLQQASTSLFSKIAWRSTEDPPVGKTDSDPEKKDEKPKKRLSKGRLSIDKIKTPDVLDETKSNQPQSLSPDKNTEDFEATSSASSSPGKTLTEDNKTEDNTTTTEDMPAFSDLIMEGIQEHSKPTVTPSSPLNLHKSTLFTSLLSICF